MKCKTILKIPVYPGLYLGVLCALFECLFQHWVFGTVSISDLICAVCYSTGFGLALGCLIDVIPKKRLHKWLTALAAVLLAVLYLMMFFVTDAYHMFMTPAVILSGAKGVAEDYGNLVVSLLVGEFGRIALMLLPAVLMLVFGSRKHRKKAIRIACAAGIPVFYAAGLMALYLNQGSLELLGLNLDYENGIRSLGLPTAFLQSAFVDTFGQHEELFRMEDIQLPTGEEIQAPTEEGTPTPSQPVVYEPNVMELDFDFLSVHGYGEISKYVQAQPPTMKNEYTGLFSGKNLILITAEAFTAEVIDEQRTPTLYRMAHQGIHFTDYYQPAWGASTSSGEMSNLFGIIPDASGGMGQMAYQKPFITMGHQLMRQGYFSMAFHNNTGTFYNRNQTHTNLGYAQFITPDVGMKVTGLWPQSDLEMMEDTIPRFIDERPFSVYYMTVSGHSVYTQGENAISKKNYAVVQDLEYSEPVKCYLAANMELEYAMDYLISALEEAGIADDTVIVISPDHYPYGLDCSLTWGNRTSCLDEFFGCEVDTDQMRDHSALIIWSGCLEGKEIVVDDPVYSLDLLPTLSNLFGLEFDSRLLVGRDVFSDAAPLVLWPNGSWITREGSYYSQTKEFVPKPGYSVNEEYVEYISTLVKNKRNYSYAAQRGNFFGMLGRLLYETN